MSIQHWPRWITASINKHFDARKQSLPLFIEGKHRETRSEKDFLELRRDGPYLTELSKGLWRVYVEVNILIQSAMDDTNMYRIDKNVGITVVACTDIPVYKYGDESYDDGSLLGCLNVVADNRGKERIQVNHFGKINTSTPLIQATVEVHYEMKLSV
jgi:hypothetical protein